MTQTPMPDTTLTSAVNELKTHQTQLDMDGVMVGVSRQALDIVLEALARAGLEAGKAEESMRERAALACEAEAYLREANGDAAEAGDKRWGPDTKGASMAQYHKSVTAAHLATAIRALPLTGVDTP